MIETSGIDHVVLHVKNPQQSKKFYTEILGMTVYRDFPDQVFMHAGAQGIALFKKADDGPAAGGDLNHLALNVAGGTLKAELEAHGVAVAGRPGDDRCIYFSDPDGHRLQLIFRR
jgi:catechol 2,3-dioxygenase-like lactoylglutathione lyase family enzyme